MRILIQRYNQPAFNTGLTKVLVYWINAAMCFVSFSMLAESFVPKIATLF